MVGAVLREQRKSSVIALRPTREARTSCFASSSCRVQKISGYASLRCNYHPHTHIDLLLISRHLSSFKLEISLTLENDPRRKCRMPKDSNVCVASFLDIMSRLDDT